MRTIAQAIEELEFDDSQTRLVAELGAHPGWAVLGGVVKDKMDREFRGYANELMRGDYPDIEEIQYRRGFFAGMKFLLDRPSRASKKLERGDS